jgi:hypothetical protein
MKSTLYGKLGEDGSNSIISYNTVYTLVLIGRAFFILGRIRPQDIHMAVFNGFAVGLEILSLPRKRKMLKTERARERMEIPLNFPSPHQLPNHY